MDTDIDLLVRMIDQTRADLNSGFTGVHDRLDELNGRTRKNAEGLVALDVKMKRLEPIESHVIDIQSHGCAAFEQHRAMLSPAELVEEDRPKWPRRRQVVAGGGLVVGGALLTELVKFVGKFL